MKGPIFISIKLSIYLSPFLIPCYAIAENGLFEVNVTSLIMLVITTVAACAAVASYLGQKNKANEVTEKKSDFSNRIKEYNEAVDNQKEAFEKRVADEEDAVSYKSNLFKEFISDKRSEIDQKVQKSSIFINKTAERFMGLGHEKINDMRVANDKELKKLYKRYIRLNEFSKPMERDLELIECLQKFQEQSGQKPKRSFLRGIWAMQELDYDNALKHLTHAVEEKIDLKSKYFFKAIVTGRLAVKKGDQKLYDEAYKDFSYVIDESPDENARAYNGRGYFHLKNNEDNIADAKKDFLTAIRIKKDYWLGCINLVETYILEENYEEARKRLRRKSLAIQKEANDADDYKAIMSFFRFVASVLEDYKKSGVFSEETTSKHETKYLLDLNKIKSKRVWDFINFEEWLSDLEISERLKIAIIKNKSRLNANRRSAY